IAVMMVAGLLGTVVPLIPGLPLIWAAALGYGFLGGFTLVDALVMTLMSVLLLAGAAAKYVLAGRRSTVAPTPRSTLVAGGLLGAAGFFAVPVVGFLLGAAGGVLLAERRRSTDWSSAWVAAKHVISGFGFGVLLEMGAGLVMIGCWALWAYAQT
ncbi:MAG: DUF456 domain-containing protein, partial [Actinomycetota bacterium]|nr:DUF456 domain-containing protein [Actinomycetota bacterium]